MSSASYMLDKLQPLTVGDLKRFLSDFPDDYIVCVPSLNRAPGTFIKADHVLLEFKERAVYLDGDVAELGKASQCNVAPALKLTGESQ